MPRSGQATDDSYVAMSGRTNASSTELKLSPAEIARIKEILRAGGGASLASESQDSDYPYFQESTHAWAVFADDPNKRAGPLERILGTLIIVFQLLAYYLFAEEAIEDYYEGRVPVLIDHSQCIAADFEPQGNFECEAEFTNDFDAFVAFCMLAIFLASDFINAGRAILGAPFGPPMLFAALAGVEVVCAFIAASIAISYNLYIGEVTDAVEVGVGLLFIRELSQRTYAGVRHGEKRQYKTFFSVLICLIIIGMFMDPFCEWLFAGGNVQEEL